MTFRHLIPFFATVFAAGTASAGAAEVTNSTTTGALTVAATQAGESGARDLGHATNLRVDLSIVVPYREASALKALVKAQRDPASPLYRHFVSAQQFRQYFAPTPDTYARTLVALQRAGFSVEPSSNRTVVHASGDARLAERYFGTRINRVVERNGRPAYANVTQATIPRELGAAAVVGLNNLVKVRVASSRGTASRRLAATVGGPLFGPDGGFGPVAIAKAEDFPVEHGYTGKNSNVADLFDASILDSDVAAFLTEFGITRSGPRTTTLRVNGGCGSSCNDSLGGTLDAEWALAMAPAASLYIYQVPFLSNGNIADGFNRIASDDAVNIVNVSFGACETSDGDLLLAIQPLIAQGAAEGITYESVAYGGASLCSVPQLAIPMAPADFDTVTAVGGSNTIVEQSGNQLYETGFPFSNGGVSLLIPVPPWQAKTPGVDSAGRNVPDIVIPAEVDGTGPSIYYLGRWQGGFALINNAPFAGYLATVQEMYGYATPMGNVAPALYAAFDKYGYRSGGALFSDVTLGCNGIINSAPVCAKPGYDITSGIGSIAHGYALAKSFNFGPISPAHR